jgi:xylulokinase
VTPTPAERRGEGVLGVDVGTTAVKAAVVGGDGRLHGAASVEYPTRYPRLGWVEQDPGDWWRAACGAVRGALRQAGGDPVEAVCVSAQAPTLLALDGGGRPLRPALIWMDRRAETECARLRESLGEETVQEITGNRIDPYFVAPKLLWFRGHEPELFSRARVYIQATGELVRRLTGELTLDREHASLLSLRDLREETWSEPLCAAVGVTPELFPRLVDGDEIVGSVTDAAAEATGLRAGTPVTGGTVDGPAAALEAGVVDQGQAAEMTGASTVLILPLDRPRSESAFVAMRHAARDRWLLLGAMVASGGSLRWLRDVLRADSFDALTAEASPVPPGSAGLVFLPYMMGERSPIWDSDARGVFLGLTLASGRGALVRAVLEGSAFALRHNLEVAAEAGIAVGELRSVGGGARSRLWSQIKADVTGIPVSLPETSIGAPFGDAALAAVAAGLHADVRGLVGTIRVRERFEPRADARPRYDELYGVYRGAYEALRGQFGRLAAAG